MARLRSLTAASAKALDRRAAERFGIPIVLLMENAGAAVAQEAAKMVPAGSQITVFCGKGNNGGDGFVAARHLIAAGFKPLVFLAGKAKEVVHEAKVNLDILYALKQPVIEIGRHNLSLPKKHALVSRLIIDALLGVGLKGKTRGVYRDLIKAINASKAQVISVDIPSGLDATSGRILGCCVRADTTVTFVARKRGMNIGDGPGCCGKVLVKNLGLPL
ncbi:MAG: NAD(P)H-hydrate epimerase [Candidatus Omnitrophota bacterium]|jgi:NAD(P)H-hydrate epimerase|nr:MAG: NAD(P)H-hydrate epimerase [Candidatus Omnitrophota bacterium]